MPGGAIGQGMMGKFKQMFGGGAGGGFGSIANMISGGGGQGMIPGGPQGMFPPGPGGAGGGGFSQMFDQLNIQNLLPSRQGGPNDSVFDMVDNETFVRKIKKSNYAEIAKKL